MSYILDALKKSDKERQLGKVPDLTSIHDTFPASYENRSVSQWIKYIFTAAVLVLLISIPATTWWYWRTDSANPDAPVVAETPQPIITEPGKNIQVTVDTEPERNDSTSPPPPPAAKTLSKTVILLPDQTKPPQEKAMPVSLPSQKPLGIPAINKLPSSIQTTIPKLRLAGHTYSDTPSKRMIIINDNILREGDRVNSTIKLVEITWTGVILDHNGLQFSVDME